MKYTLLKPLNIAPFELLDLTSRVRVWYNSMCSITVLHTGIYLQFRNNFILLLCYTHLGDLYQWISIDVRGGNILIIFLFTFFFVMLLSFVKGYIKEVKKNIPSLIIYSDQNSVLSWNYMYVEIVIKPCCYYFFNTLHWNTLKKIFMSRIGTECYMGLHAWRDLHNRAYMTYI